jgi:hypothetical protein
MFAQRIIPVGRRTGDTSRKSQNYYGKKESGKESKEKR